MNKYYELKQKHQEEINDFSMFFAFNDEQFEKGMEKLELEPKDTKKILSIGAGGFIRKADDKKFFDIFSKHEKEMQEAIKTDKTGEGFIFDMFCYELANHEFIVTWNTSDTLEALGLTLEKVNNNKILLKGLKLAKKDYRII